MELAAFIFPWEGRTKLRLGNELVEKRELKKRTKNKKRIDMKTGTQPLA